MAVEFTLQNLIPAPRDAVFQAHLDIDAFQEWMPGCKEVVKLTDGPAGAGTRWRETRQVGRFEATEEFLIKSCETPSTLSLYCDGTKGSNGRGEYFFDYEFVETDEGTQVNVRGKIDMGGFVPNLFMKLFKGMFIKQMKKDMEAIKSHLAQ